MFVREPLSLPTMLLDNFRVESPDVEYGTDSITSTYNYQSTDLQQDGASWVARPTNTQYKFKTDTKVPKLGYVDACCTSCSFPACRLQAAS